MVLEFLEKYRQFPVLGGRYDQLLRSHQHKKAKRQKRQKPAFFICALVIET